MALHFHQLTVRDIRMETDDCISVSFDIPENLKAEFLFRQGQNITIRKSFGGEELRRSYSICSSPAENELRIAIKKMSGGRFSDWANQHLKTGDILELLPPTGKFNTLLDPVNRKNYLAFAAGSGITPVISIIKTTLVEEPLSRFTLVFGNRDRKSIIFREELENLKNRYMEQLQLIHILSRERTDNELTHGRINDHKCHELCKRLLDIADFDEIFICGPEEMIFAVKKFLEEKGIRENNIHFELFSTPQQGQGTRIGGSIEAKHMVEQTVSTIQIRLDGLVTTFTLPSQGETILNAALRKGIDLPYACKGGVCSTCRAKLQEGEVFMDQNYALEAEELAAGFILTCQSHPKTARVFVDYDAR
jgi:ring-1,2-phenylacetyl-CoA epoxidase subunit PaaE